MKINIDYEFDSVKDLEELKKKLTFVLSQLQNDLQSQPNFLLVTGDDQEVPNTLAANTLIFKFDETDIVKTGYFDGENIILP